MNKLFKSCLAVCALSAASVATLTGCNKTTSVDYDHTIVFYSTQGDNLQKVTQRAIDAFEAKYKGWKIKHTQVGGYDDVKEKVVQDLQGNIQPDLAYCYADHVAQYIQTSKVIDMKPLIESTAKVDVPILNGETGEYETGKVEETLGYTAAEIADFVPGYYAEGKASEYGGSASFGYDADGMLTLPFSKSTELLYCNLSALEAQGLEPATTWDELWEQCDILHKAYPKSTPLGYDSEANWFITMCEQNGWGYTSAEEPHYLFNNDGTKAWLGKLAEYYDKGLVTTQADYGAYTSNLFAKGTDGGCIYCIGSSGGASYQKPAVEGAFEVGVAPIPGSGTGSDYNRSVISQGPSLVMLKCGRAKDADLKAKMTFLFVKYLMDPTFQAEFSIASGYNPVRKSTFDIPAYAEHLEGTSMTALAAACASKMTDDFYTSPAFVGSSTARTQVGNALVFAMTGQKTPEKALADAYRNCGGK